MHAHIANGRDELANAVYREAARQFIELDLEFHRNFPSVTKLYMAVIGLTKLSPVAHHEIHNLLNEYKRCTT